MLIWFLLFWGGLCGSGKIAVSIHAYKSGARTKFASYTQSIMYIPIIFFALPYIQYLPNAVLGGVAISIGIRLIDPSLIKQLMRIIFNKNHNQSLHQQFNFFVVFVIVCSTLIWDMLIAMLLGLMLSIIFFLYVFSGSIIRRELTGNALQSIYRRNVNARNVIDKNRDSIVVLQLEGAVFFGSVEILARRIDELVEKDICFIILDMRRVVEIDNTGASILRQQQLMARDKGVQLLVSYVNPASSIYKELNYHGVCSFNSHDLCFPDTSSAFIWCEERILEEKKSDEFTDKILSLKHIELFNELDEYSLKLVAPYLRKTSFAKDSIIFKQGDKGDFVLFIVQGNVEVYVNLQDAEHSKQLQILGPGTVAGEMAFIDTNPRSANLRATNNVVCLTMTRKLYQKLLIEHPMIATKILSGFCLIFSERLRSANKMISELEI